MRSVTLLLCLGLALTIGAASTRSAPPGALSFAPQTSKVTAPAKASLLVDGAGGRFVRVKAKGSAIALADAIGDLNGDGRPDLVTHYNDDEDDTCSESDGVEVCYAYAYVTLSRKNGTYRALHAVYENDLTDVAATAIGDVNRDGRKDLLIATADSLDGFPGVVVMLGIGKGKFKRAQFVRTANPLAITTSDVNGDGRLDVLTASSNGTVSVLLNNGGRLSTARSYRVGLDPSALAVGDLNGDRRPDLAVARSAGAVRAVTVLLNRGGGSFGSKRSYPTGSQPASVAIGDLNGDRRPDLVTANTQAGTASVLLNAGRGRFRAKLDYATADLPFAVAVGTFNGDGRRDLVIATYSSDPVSVLVNTPGLCNVQDVWGLAKASATAKLGAAGCKIGTVSHAASKGFRAGRIIGESPDPGAVLKGGAVDLTVSDGPGPGAIKAAPSFGAAQSYAIPKGGDGVAIADLNGDGAADVVSVSCGHSVSVLLNKGHGALAAHQDYLTASCPQIVQLADLNGDGKPDIVTGNEDGIVSVLLNLGDGTFGPKHDYERGGEGALADGTFFAIGDLNGDGKPDLATSNGFESAKGLSVLLNNGNGTFAARRDYSLAAGAEAIAAGDFNSDGKLDLVTDAFGDLTVLLNDGGAEFHVAGEANAGGADFSTVFVGDLNADGYPDVVVVNEGSAAQVLLDNVTGKLRPSVAYRASSNILWAAIGDANKDGTQDLVTVGKTLSVLRNRGDGAFLPKRDYTMGPKQPRSVAIGDLNGDGRLDLVSANGATVVVRLAR